MSSIFPHSFIKMSENVKSSKCSNKFGSCSLNIMKGAWWPPQVPKAANLQPQIDILVISQFWTLGQCGRKRTKDNYMNEFSNQHVEGMFYDFVDSSGMSLPLKHMYTNPWCPFSEIHHIWKHHHCRLSLFSSELFLLFELIIVMLCLFIISLPSLEHKFHVCLVQHKNTCVHATRLGT